MTKTNLETLPQSSVEVESILTHQKSVASPGLVSSNTGNARIRVACQRCVKAKVRCDSRRPCSRCERQQKPEQCLDRPTRGADGVKRKHHRLLGGFRPCLPCMQRKIRCDSFRPCSRCRERQCGNQCIDRAVVVDLGSTFSNVIPYFENPIHKFTRVPSGVTSVLKHGFRRFSPSTVQQFLESPRRNAFRLALSMYLDDLESRTLMKQLECFAEKNETHSTDRANQLSLVSSEIIFPTEAVFPLVSISHVYVPFGGLIKSCYMNDPAKAIWGYSDSDMQSAFQQAYSDGLEYKKFKNVAFMWRLWHPCCWPAMTQNFMEFWISGDGVYDMLLYAVRKDYKMVRMQTRWYMKFGESGMLERAVVAANPL